MDEQIKKMDNITILPSGLMLAGARLRYLADTKWGTRRYLNMDRVSRNAKKPRASA